MSVQTNEGIERLIEAGEIIMQPHRPGQINNGSVDVTLGRFIARIRPEFQPLDFIDVGISGQMPSPINIDVNKLTGAEVFELEDLVAHGGKLVLKPFERVLAHTHEFIGSRRRSIPEMRAKSSTARWGLTVCACAGWGDAGYFSRWAMEILNMNPCETTIDMGTLIAQIVFHEIDALKAGTLYHEKGNYQVESNVEALIAEWHPRQLLPKTMKVVDFEPMNHVDKNGL